MLHEGQDAGHRAFAPAEVERSGRWQFQASVESGFPVADRRAEPFGDVGRCERVVPSSETSEVDVEHDATTFQTGRIRAKRLQHEDLDRHSVTMKSQRRLTRLF